MKILRYDQLKFGQVVPSHEKPAPAMWTLEKRKPGEERLLLEFQSPQAKLPIQSMDVSLWLRWSKLYEAFCDAAIRCFARRRHTTRSESIRNLRRGWFAFLKARKEYDLEISDIDRHLIDDFVLWLDSLPISESTRSTYFGAFRSVMRALQQNSTTRELPSLDFHSLKGPWRCLAKKAKPTRVLTDDAWRALYVACVDEIEDTIAKVSADWDLIERAKPSLAGFQPTSQRSYQDLGICLAELERTFPHVIPARTGIFGANPHLDNGIVRFHNYTRIALPFHPRPRLLIPFILLLGMQLYANRSLLLGSELKDFSVVDLFGRSRLIWRRMKYRAGVTQMRSIAVTEDVDNPQRLLEFLKKWTARIRPVASSRFADRLFLFVPEFGEGKESMSFTIEHAGSSAWSTNLKRFLRDQKLRKVTLRMIRASGLDQVRNAFSGDDAAVAAAGNQRTSSTIRRSYYSAGARARAEEQVGGVIELRTRLILAKGRIDPRRLPSDQDKSSATPGWTCLDPWDSPIPGQIKGRLCHAYGACPVCPLARQNCGSPYALARTLQLKEAVIAAMTTTPGKRWLAAWKPVLEALNRLWLPRFTARSVISGAAKLTLEPLPGLE